MQYSGVLFGTFLLLRVYDGKRLLMSWNVAFCSGIDLGLFEIGHAARASISIQVYCSNKSGLTCLCFVLRYWAVFLESFGCSLHSSWKMDRVEWNYLAKPKTRGSFFIVKKLGLTRLILDRVVCQRNTSHLIHEMALLWYWSLTGLLLSQRSGSQVQQKKKYGARKGNHNCRKRSHFQRAVDKWRHTNLNWAKKYRHITGHTCCSQCS